MSDVERIEIVPGLALELDTALWEFVDGYGIEPRGRNPQITFDLRITTDEAGERKAESVIIVRTA